MDKHIQAIKECMDVVMNTDCSECIFEALSDLYFAGCSRGYRDHMEDLAEVLIDSLEESE